MTNSFLIANLQAAGVAQVLIALLHFRFEKHFLWKQELSTINLLTRQIFYVHTFFVALVVFLMGLLGIFCAKELVECTKLASALNIGLLLFWLTRLYVQFFVFKPEIWKENLYYTVIHYVLALIWFWFSTSYGIMVISHLNNCL